MNRAKEKLSGLAVQRFNKKGFYSDGGGLYLQVSPGITKSWVFRFALNHRKRYMGLGSYPEISLNLARKIAAECRTKVQLGIDPIEERVAGRRQRALESAKNITFDECVEQCFESKRAEWSNQKHADTWRSPIRLYASPEIGKLSVQDVQREHIFRILDPIWREKTETATRLQQRIAIVLDYAKVRGYRTGENPAAWKGNLDKILPKPSKVKKVVHHAALPFQELAPFMLKLRQEGGVAPRALEFLILTATRTTETLLAKWPEVNFDDRSWTIPAERMKSRREHKVPLSERAIAILRELQSNSTSSEFIFPSPKGTRLSDMSLLAVLRRMEINAVSHGFRSTFRDWVGERTNYTGDIAEAALAHIVRDKTEAAYRRGTLFEKRRQLMSDWAVACETEIPNNVVEMKIEAVG